MGSARTDAIPDIHEAIGLVNHKPDPYPVNPRSILFILHTLYAAAAASAMPAKYSSSSLRRSS